jgi:NET1-associated nuclear protein 1 (U3 small nucleolar RNA-associated protein 17)
MSTKRDLEEAFGEHEPATPHPAKRKRRSRGKKPAPSAGSHEESPSRSHNALVPVDGKAQTNSPKSPQKPKQVLKKSSKYKKNGEHKSRKKNSKRIDAAQKGWTLSAGYGGFFLNQDPILTQDDKYLILPTASCVQIYSTATSLLVRSLDIDDYITSCVLPPATPTEILISSSRGFISRWDWTTGGKIHQWRCRKGAVWILGSMGAQNEQVILLHENSKGQTEISRCNLDQDSSHPGIQKTILSSERSILPTMRASSDGRILALCAGDRLYLGQLDQGPGNPSESSYTWREATIPGMVVSMDARFRQETTKHGSTRTAVDVVLGFKDGVILIYEDILYGLIGKEKGIKTADISSRRLHWHRDTVKTVKWSRDGNYLISGGNETVLVIWQLDTNQKQFLPHLSTAILNLTVSAAGSSYALRLANNSVMVLSTADLKPYANVSNLAVNQTATDCRAVLHPQKNNQLMAAVPRVSRSSQHKVEKENATLLQTFDITAGLQIDRQALTRNVTTTINVAPTGHKVAEPDVILLQIGHDGQWLMSVEEWNQPDGDLDPIYSISDEKRVQRRSKETCLRFWHWNEVAGTWELVTRVDEPHPRAAVLQMAVHPARQEVATVGADGYLRIWSPKSRYRSGVAVRNQSGEQLHTWKCSRVLQVERLATAHRSGEDPSATLAYSEDGSVIAASWSSLSMTTRSVHFIDSQSGTLRLSQPNLLAPGKAQIGFLGKYLLCLSRSFSIWDTVNSKMTFTISLSDVFNSTGSTCSLAINGSNSTFALAFNAAHVHGSAQVAIFDIQKLKEKPVSHVEVRGKVKLLLPLSKSSGFVIIDEQNRIRQLMPPGSVGLSPLMSAQREDVTNSLNNIFGSGAITHQAVNEDSGDVVRAALPAPESRTGMRSLEALFGFSASLKLSSVSDLFEKVAGLFARPTAAAP